MKLNPPPLLSLDRRLVPVALNCSNAGLRSFPALNVG